MKRREFLRGVGAAATLGLAGCKSDATPKPGKVPPGPTGEDAIEHIVFVMMENRSFDHYLGALALAGRADVDGLSPGLQNLGYDGAVYEPHRVPGPDLCPGDPPHGWSSGRVQFAGGSNGGFVKAYVDRHGRTNAQVPMGYYDDATLPILWALAEEFAICDQWFCSLLSSTWPNRLYAHCAQNQGQYGNDMPPGEVFYDAPSIWDSLDEAEVSWGYYFSDAPFTAILGMDMTRDTVGTVEQFFAHCRSGTLPTVSQVEPAFLFNDDHPPHHPMLGQIFLGSIYEALAQSPLWGKTLLVITYDEHGGFYDHVPPPTVPDDRPQTGHNQLGFRVPALVVGPWVKPGYVSRLQYDHTSWIAHLNHKFGLDPLTRRDKHANDLSDLIQDSAPLEPPILPVIELSEEEIAAQCHDLSERSGSQPELERLLDQLDLGPRFDRRRNLERVAAVTLEEAQRLGVLRVR